MQYKVQLDEAHTKEFIKHIYRQTMPIRAHEAEIVRNILQTNHEQHDWRTASNVFCPGCRRETTVLDLFLSGLTFHSPKYINDFLYNNGHGHGEIAFKKDGMLSIEVYHHSLVIRCIQCGMTIKDHFAYFYKRPVKPNCVIAVSEIMFERFHALAQNDMAKKHQKDTTTAISHDTQKDNTTTSVDS
ncbi:hypothetical protein [Azospirillum argentinense]|uniref:hypothetical protein n=1 Tax=Azospirillum argentinense TaxID=2970906 RepID=UPI001186C002|nr:hypothetical protein [Azospirillum argentinense]